MINEKQAEVLRRLEKGDKLHACDHVCLADGISYFFEATRNIHGNTIHALFRRKLIEVYNKSVGGWNYRITEQGREALHVFDMRGKK